MNLLVTGTDTGVGKTRTVAGLVRAARAAGTDAIAMKPFCTGGRDDVRRLQAAQDACEPDHLINPVWMQTPVAPFAAAAVENRHVDVTHVREVYAGLAARHAVVVVEGAGGLLVPIQQAYDFADLAADLGLAVVVVAANRLGAINHLRLTLEALSRRRLRCQGVVLNDAEVGEDVATATNPGILAALLPAGPPLLRVSHGQEDFTALLPLLSAGL